MKAVICEISTQRHFTETSQHNFHFKGPFYAQIICSPLCRRSLLDQKYSYEEEEGNEQDSMKNLEKKIYLPCVC